MTGNLLHNFRTAGQVCLLASALALLTGCGFKLAGPGETISIPALATEDLDGSCKFELNMPDQPLSTLGKTPPGSVPEPKQVAALVIYERGDSSDLFNDGQIQSMAASLHMVTVFAKQCNSKVTGDIQPDSAKGPGRTLFAALTQYALDSGHPEIGSLPVVLSGFSAAGVLSTTMANNFPDRVLAFLPYAAGSAYLDLDTVPVSPAAARIPALVLANAYDEKSGVMRSLRYFQRGLKQGAPWGFGVQNHTDHCCTLSTRDVLIPWVTAVVQPLETGATIIPNPVGPKAAGAAGPVTPNVRFLCYTDGFYDSYGESNCWIPTASVLPATNGGPQVGWLPSAEAASAWMKWVLSPETN